MRRRTWQVPLVCATLWTVTNCKIQIDIHPADRAKAASGTAANEATDAETISDADSDDMTAPGAGKFRIIVSDPSGQMGEEDDDEDGDDEDDEDEDEDPGLDEANSPMDDLKTFDWGEADAELAEFLADDDGDESESGEDGKAEMDSETEAEGDSTFLSAGGTKRKHEEDSESDSNDAPRTESLMAKKQRIARNRGASGLREVQTPDGADSNGSSLPTPKFTADEMTSDVDLLKQKAGMVLADNDDDIDDAQLEADLMAELEADEAEFEAERAAEKG